MRYAHGTHNYTSSTNLRDIQKAAAQSTDLEADDIDDEERPLSPSLNQTNGMQHHSISSAVALGLLARSRSAQGLAPSPPPPSDTSTRLDAIVKERDALRQEVIEMRKSLEGIQSKHEAGASEEAQTKHEEEIRGLKEELDEANEGKEHFETQYKNLLGRVNTIKTSLGDRLKADTVGAHVQLCCPCIVGGPPGQAANPL